MEESQPLQEPAPRRSSCIVDNKKKLHLGNNFIHTTLNNMPYCTLKYVNLSLDIKQFILPTTYKY